MEPDTRRCPQCDYPVAGNGEVTRSSRAGLSDNGRVVAFGIFYLVVSAGAYVALAGLAVSDMARVIFGCATLAVGLVGFGWVTVRSWVEKRQAAPGEPTKAAQTGCKTTS